MSTRASLSELSTVARRFTIGVANIAEPQDQQVITFDLKAKRPYTIEYLLSQLDTGSVEVEILINNVAVAGFDPLAIAAGGVNEDEPTATGPVEVAVGDKVTARISVSTGTPEGLALQLGGLLDPIHDTP